MTVSRSEIPPPVIDSAKLLIYAENDGDVVYTDKICLYVGEQGRLGEMPNLAICLPYNQCDNFLLFFCDHNWECQGVISFNDLNEAKLKAERGYEGISKKWIASPYSEEDVKDYLRDEYEVDPTSEWWKSICSFCRNEDLEGTCVIGSTGTIICGSCVTKFYDAMNQSILDES